MKEIVVRELGDYLHRLKESRYHEHRGCCHSGQLLSNAQQSLLSLFPVRRAIGLLLASDTAKTSSRSRQRLQTMG